MVERVVNVKTVSEIFIIKFQKKFENKKCLCILKCFIKKKSKKPFRVKRRKKNLKKEIEN